jgi:hypothetical protein
LKEKMKLLTPNEHQDAGTQPAALQLANDADPMALAAAPERAHPAFADGLADQNLL